MHISHISVKSLFTGLLCALVLPAGNLSPAQALTPTQMTAFSMTPAVASPTGLGTTAVTISTHLVDPDGITPVDAVFDSLVVARCPCVLVTLASPSLVPQRTFRYVPLTLTSGTSADGTWTGRFVLGAGQTGHWKAQILAGDFGQALIPAPVYEHSAFDALPSPFTNVGVDIHGTNRPVIGLLSLVKQANGRYLLKGAVTRATSHTPVRNTRFEVTAQCNAVIETRAVIGVRTNSLGVYAVSLTKAQLGGGYPGDTVCVYQVAYPGPTLLTQSVNRPVR